MEGISNRTDVKEKAPEEKLDRMISEELFERDYTVFDDET